MRIENYGGTGILLSAVTHLAQTLPARYVFGLYDYVSPQSLSIVRNPLKVLAGRISVPIEAGPGLASMSMRPCWENPLLSLAQLILTHNSGRP